MEIPKKRPKPSTISFLDEIDEPIKLKKFCKNPNIITEKIQEESKLIQEIKQNYNQEMKKDGLEKIELTFSYWDGTNAKKSLTVNKSDTISEFLIRAKDILKKDYPALEQSHSLMFVKEDKIIPHEYKFQDIIRSEARGSKGFLFNLSKSGDKWVDLGYTIKILERKWYEKNKHIFPASRWTIYEPN